MSTLIANDGTRIEEGTPVSIVYNGTNVDYIDYHCGRGIYRETFTYVGDQLTAISIPTKQP